PGVRSHEPADIAIGVWRHRRANEDEADASGVSTRSVADLVGDVGEGKVAGDFQRRIPDGERRCSVRGAFRALKPWCPANEIKNPSAVVVPDCDLADAWDWSGVEPGAQFSRERQVVGMQNEVPELGARSHLPQVLATLLHRATEHLGNIV